MLEGQLPAQRTQSLLVGTLSAMCGCGCTRACRPAYRPARVVDRTLVCVWMVVAGMTLVRRPSLVSELSSVHLYLLWDTGALSCYELRQDLSACELSPLQYLF